MKPLNNLVLVRKCVNDHVREADGKVLIYRTDYDFDTTNWCEIVDIGPKTTVVTRDMIGWLVQCPENVPGMHRVGEDLWMIRDDLLLRKELAGIAVLL